jgi:hypothetical protein
MRNVYQVRIPDFDLSPFTGMTRNHFIECAKFCYGKHFVDYNQNRLGYNLNPGEMKS